MIYPMSTKLLSKRTVILLCCATVMVVWAAGYGFDRLLVREKLPRHEVLAAANLPTGAVAGALLWAWAEHERKQKMVIRQRMQVVADMNHHIRNALEVITYAAVQRDGDAPLTMIQDSVNRIDWVLREVLPQLSEYKGNNHSGITIVTGQRTS
jgi:hypothetical protein